MKSHRPALGCETAVEVLVMHERDFRKLYYQNPDFGMYLARLITQRFIETLAFAQTLRCASEG